MFGIAYIECLIYSRKSTKKKYFYLFLKSLYHNEAATAVVLHENTILPKKKEGNNISISFCIYSFSANNSR